MNPAGEFPPVSLIEIEVVQSAEVGGLREVTPYVDRQPNGDWSFMFYDGCEKADDLEWYGAGFVRCRPEEVERVRERLTEIVAEVNERFAQFLSTAEPADKAAELLELEGISAASVDGRSYRITFP